MVQYSSSRLDASFAALCDPTRRGVLLQLGRADASITELAEKEDLQRVRPDLDGNEIMAILGIPAGPQVGQAWKYLKELRLDRGPLDHDEAVDELRKWWNAQHG